MPFLLTRLASTFRHRRVFLDRDLHSRLPPSPRNRCVGAHLWLGRGRDPRLKRDTAASISGITRCMSDYLTRLIERSVGLPPQIEPLIAPIHAPSTQMLSEPVETSAAFESGPAAKIETSQQDTPPGVAVNTRRAEAAVSRAENPPPRSSTPLPESRAELRVERKDDRSHPSESPRKVRSRQTPSASHPEAVNITGASPPAPPPLSHVTRIVSKEKNQIVVQPEVVNHVNSATAPLVPAQESSSKESRLLPRATTTAS